MSLRNLTSRIAAISMLLAVFAAAGAMIVPMGCGGGSKKSSGKKGSSKKGGSKKGTPKKDEPPAMSEEQIAREMVKDTFTGVYTEYYGGNQSEAQLYKALLEAIDGSKDFPPEEKEKFDYMMKGLCYGRAELGEWIVKKKKNEAMADPGDLEKGKALLQEAADFLKPIDRSKLKKVTLGEGGNEIDYQGYYDKAKAELDKAFKEFEDTASIVARTPPAGEVDILAQDENLWAKDKGAEITISAGEMVLEGKARGASITSKHFFLHDFTLKLSFVINSGGFDLVARAMPGSGSPFFAGYDQGDIEGDSGTIVIEVEGNTARFLDGEGRELLDPMTRDDAPKGGTFAIQLRGENASLTIRSLTVEAK